MIETKTKTRAPYRYHSDKVWALIREGYLEGRSARALAEMFGATVAAIRARIQREGWSKRALAEARAEAIVAAMTPTVKSGDQTVADLEPRPPIEPREAVRAAVETAVRWMRAGQLGQAAEAARLADVLGRAVGRLEAGDGPVEGGGPSEDQAVDAAAFEAVRRKVLGVGNIAPPPPWAVPLPAFDGEEME